MCYWPSARAITRGHATVLSFGRFLSVSFPHFLALGALVERRPLLLAIVVGVFVVLRCVLAKGLVAWEFVG